MLLMRNVWCAALLQCWRNVQCVARWQWRRRWHGGAGAMLAMAAGARVVGGGWDGDGRQASGEVSQGGGDGSEVKSSTEFVDVVMVER